MLTTEEVGFFERIGEVKFVLSKRGHERVSSTCKTSFQIQSKSQNWCNRRLSMSNIEFSALNSFWKFEYE